MAARSLAATLAVAPALAALFWMSGAVTIPAAAASMALFVLVVMEKRWPTFASWGGTQLADTDD